MKTLITALSLMLSFNAFAQTSEYTVVAPTCEKGELKLVTNKNKAQEWQLTTKTNTRKWLLVKNEETKLLYPKQEITKMSGRIIRSDFPLNKGGHKLVVMEVSKGESDKLTEHIKVCAKKGDCSLPIKLDRCTVAELPIHYKK